MGQTKHTPGPWGHMAGMPTNVLSGSGLRVARCDFDGDFDHPTAHANARLIATAPEMLDALRDLLDVVTGRKTGDAVAVMNAETAVARATGLVP